jgi:hypothetical protein
MVVVHQDSRRGHGLSNIGCPKFVPGNVITWTSCWRASYCTIRCMKPMPKSQDTARAYAKDMLTCPSTGGPVTAWALLTCPAAHCPASEQRFFANERSLAGLLHTGTGNRCAARQPLTDGQLPTSPRYHASSTLACSAVRKT